MRWLQAILPKEERFFTLFAEHAFSVVRGAEALRAGLAGVEALAEKLRQVMDCEHEGDRIIITREVLLATRRSFITPFDRGDITRLILDDVHLAEIVQHPKVELYAVHDEDGREVGILELDFREPHECELAFIGLVPELAGQGLGKWLLAEAVGRAWREGVDRVHVHTCSLDHPAALAAYRRAGFIPYKRAVERFPDPRLLGILPRESAPQIPLFGTLT